jgi:LemA protein
MVALLTLCAFCLWVVYVYNRLVAFNALAQDGLNGIDMQLKQRHEQVAHLIATVKEYAPHEREVLERVTLARSNTIKAATLPQKATAEDELSGALKSIFAIAGRYPDLEANQNFLHLQQELSDLESDLQLSRRYYNGAARNYNVLVQSFLTSYIAYYAGFKPKAYFETSEQEHKNYPY